MTGGRAVILGPPGKNFAAGMSGGVAYVLDIKRDLYMRINKSMVSMETVTERHDIDELRDLIERHVKATDSQLGKRILANFSAYLPSFKKIIPQDYSRMLQAILQREERGMTREQAEIDAFYATVNQ